MTTYQFRLPSSSRREGEGKSSISKSSQCNPNDLYLSGTHLKGVDRSGDEPLSEKLSNRTHSSVDSVDAMYDTRPRYQNGVRPRMNEVDLNACALDLTNRLEEAIFAKNNAINDPRLRWRAYLTSLETEGIRPSTRHGSRPSTAASRSGRSPLTPNYSETGPKRASRCVDVKYEPTLRLPSKEAEENYQRHVGSSVMQLFKHSENVSAMQRAPPPTSLSTGYTRCLTREAQEIREKFTKNHEMTATMNHEPYEPELAVPRCPSREALENLEKSRSNIDFGSMFKHRNDLDDVREYRPLGLSGEGLENRDKHLCGNAQVFTHHSEPDPDAVPRRPQVLFEGEDIYARNSGSVMSESLKTMGASQLGLTKEEPRTPVEQKPLAKSCLQELFEYKPEYDPKNAAANDNADNGKLNQHKDSAMNDTLHNYGKNEPEPAPNPKVRPEAEEYVEQARGTLTQMMSKMFVNGRIQTTGEVDGTPPCLRVTGGEAQANYEASRDGVAKNLIHRYGKLPGDPPDAPNIRTGARGPYTRAQGGAMLELLNPKRAFKLKYGRRRRAHSADRPKTAS